MLSYIFRRILATIPVLLVVGLFVFSLLYLTPGDPAMIIAGDTATPDDIAKIRASLGLDEPFIQRLAVWLWRVAHGDFGVSIFSNLPVHVMIGQRLEPTLSLALVTLAITIILALPMGIFAALKASTVLDRSIMGFAVLGFSVPVFVIGYLLILLFAVKLHWLPVQGFVSFTKDPWTFLRHIILPSVTLAVVFIALIARIVRSSMLEVLSKDYIRTAKSKGLSTYGVVSTHALKNAAVPIVTIIGVGIGSLITGVVVTETVFAIPGLGRLVVDAILKRDYPVIQGVILVFSFFYVLVNLLVDISYTLFDPRIKY